MPPFGAPSAIPPNHKYSPKPFSNQAVTKDTLKHVQKYLKRISKASRTHVTEEAYNESALLKKCVKTVKPNLQWNSESS